MNFTSVRVSTGFPMKTGDTLRFVHGKKTVALVKVGERIHTHEEIHATFHATAKNCK